MTTTTHVFYIDVMPAECAAAALLEVAEEKAGSTKCHPCTIAQASNPDIIEALIGDTAPSRLVFFGTYWGQKNLQHYHDKYNSAVVSTYDFAGPEAKKGLVNFAFDLMPKQVSKMLAKHHPQLLDLINDRSMSLNQDKTQVLFSGIDNFRHDTARTTFDKFILLFTSQVKFDEIMELGKMAMDVQQSTVKARVRNLSGEIVLQDGKTTVCICPAPDFINMTHAELHQLWPNCVASVTTTLNFKEPNVVVESYSVRSYDASVNAGDLVRKLSKGDGDANAAGGRRNVEWKLPF